MSDIFILVYYLHMEVDDAMALSTEDRQRFVNYWMRVH